MIFKFDRRDFPDRARAGETCWLLSNGLAGYMSTTGAFSVTRCDQGILIAAQSPSRRYCLVHRLSERLETGNGRVYLSSQDFADGEGEDGTPYLKSFTVDGIPVWEYEAEGVEVRRSCAIAPGANASAVIYDVNNLSGSPCRLTVRPVLQFSQKGETPPKPPELVFDKSRGEVTGEGLRLFVRSTSPLEGTKPRYETLLYLEDQSDGRRESGFAVSVFTASLDVPAGEKLRLELVFSDEPTDLSATGITDALFRRRREIMEGCGLKDRVARELAWAADAFLAKRPCCDGKTIIAGYPYFADWGRDTMIALPGCTMTTGNYEDAKSIIRTFLKFERDGLVPNLFPEGGDEPRYNTADAALLLICTLWYYYLGTGDAEFVKEAYPVMKRIISAYRHGTHHSIHMDADGLISAGAGLDQVTWMDVCVDGILPTPRHGKPVEINAYWYNALRVMAALAPLAGEDGGEYDKLASLVRESFLEKFWMEDRGCLRDVISGSSADEQIRCNQIWALTMPFTMLEPEQERRVLNTVYRHLYTSRGLRTLSPEDPEFHPVYQGSQRERDMAYHQGTVWPYPLGAWYRAYLKVNGGTPEAAARVREWLAPMEDILREGCVGQIPEIYDGLEPRRSKGCFAQAWSVAELLRVYAELERIERSDREAE